MPTFLQSIGVVLCGAWLTAGCSTTSPTRDKTASSRESSAPSAVNAIPVLTPEELDRRAEAHACYAGAVLHEYNEEWDQAKDDYFKAAQIDPSNEPLILEVSQRLLQFKEPERALSVLTNAAALPTASGALLAQLGRLQFMVGKKDQAILSNRTAIRKAPANISAYRNLAQIYLQERQYADGIKILDQAAKQTEVAPMYLIELGELYMAFLGSPSPQGTTAKARALETLKRAAGLNLTNIFHIQTLADALSMLGEDDQASTLYLRLLKNRVPLPGVRERLAVLYIRKKEYKKAAEQLQSILRDNPTHTQANFLMGSLAFEEKKLPEAVDYFRKTIFLNPDFEPVYYDLAAAQLSQREPRKALEILDKARDKFKQNFVGEYYTALAYNQLKDFTNVISHLTTAEVIARGSDETNRLNHIYYFHLGAAYERSQKFSEAEKYLKQCLKLSPDFSEALNYLGYMWAERGTNLTEARQMIEKAVKQEPKNAAFLDSLGWVFFKMGKNNEALKYLLQAVENSPEPDATLYDHLGDIYVVLQQPEKARESWGKALKLEPNPEIQKKLGATTPSTAGPK